MTDPVIDREGNSYERSAIMDWLRRCNTSPITRSTMSASDLVPNRGLRDAIEEYLATSRGSSNTSAVIHGQASIINAGQIPSPIVQIGISSCMLPRVTTEDLFVLVSVLPPDGLIRLPSDIVIVVDVSG